MCREAISTCAKVFYISFFLRTAEKPGFFLQGPIGNTD
ncbi:Uncharacterized protein dnm_030410 [Desulfonema magnum]|uniref:Uncharacterized protein n=1 Tax=Desulfonema magnum TaxID=45655 RepID=A0A975GMQ0_9BACT|nr:Uncharacterized protein dnm_030410 [Desulfonema magnum]